VTIKKILGIFLLSIPFAASFGVLGLSEGWGAVLIVIGLLCTTLVLIGWGVYLIMGDE